MNQVDSSEQAAVAGDPVYRAAPAAFTRPFGLALALALCLLAISLYEDLVYGRAFSALAGAGGHALAGAYERSLVTLTALALAATLLLAASVHAAFARLGGERAILTWTERVLLALVALAGVGALGSTVIVLRLGAERGVAYLASRPVTHSLVLDTVSLVAILAIAALSFSSEPPTARCPMLGSHGFALAAVISFMLRTRLGHLHAGPLCLAAAWVLAGVWMHRSESRHARRDGGQGPGTAQRAFDFDET